MATDRQYSPIPFTVEEDVWMELLITQQPKITMGRLHELHKEQQTKHGSGQFPDRLSGALIHRHHSEVVLGYHRESRNGRALHIRELSKMVARGTLSENEAMALV